MLDRMVALRMRKAKDVAYPFKKLPEHWIGSFNYTLANLEGPVTPTRRPTTKSISFQFAPSVVPVLKDEGIDAVSQANNHTFDQGRTGFTDSQALLKKGGLLAFGSELSDGEIALATTTINGTRFAFLGFNSVTKPFNRVDAARVIKEAKAQADFVIAMPHWGIEYQDMPTQSVVEMGHWFIDQGVDAIIGGHPHWAQGISVYKNKPIVWSLGNFVFDQDWSVRTNQGLTIAMTVEGKSVTLEPIPIQIKESQPRVVEGAEKEKRLKQLASISDEALREEILQNKIVFAR
jgi:poly-gamma-glutamate synthesis protein (capsule biosynthesis protein)